MQRGPCVGRTPSHRAPESWHQASRTVHGCWEGYGNPKLQLAAIWSPRRAPSPRQSRTATLSKRARWEGCSELRAPRKAERAGDPGSCSLPSPSVWGSEPAVDVTLAGGPRSAGPCSRSVPGWVSPRSADGVSGQRETCPGPRAPQERIGSHPHRGLEPAARDTEAWPAGHVHRLTWKQVTDAEDTDVNRRRYHLPAGTGGEVGASG